ncbi:putative membrane protein [Escherichia coli p0305293.11]|nr:putative membrane protein [Escherichia coli p0305293.11]
MGWLGAAAVSGMYAAGASMILGGWRRCWHRKPGRHGSQYR